MSRKTIPETASDAMTREELDISDSDLGLDPVGLLDSPGDVETPEDVEGPPREPSDTVPTRPSRRRRLPGA